MSFCKYQLSSHFILYPIYLILLVQLYHSHAYFYKYVYFEVELDGKLLRFFLQVFLFLFLFIAFRGRKEEAGERKRNIIFLLLFCLFMHLLIDSCICCDLDQTHNWDDTNQLSYPASQGLKSNFTVLSTQTSSRASLSGVM